MRTVFMAYLDGSVEAVAFYCEAFQAEPKNCFRHSDDDAFYAHAEIALNDQTLLAISERAHYDRAFTRGNSMQFWLAFDDEQALRKAYDVLKEKAEVHCPLSPCEWCKQAADLTDRYGIRWLLSY